MNPISYIINSRTDLSSDRLVCNVDYKYLTAKVLYFWHRWTSVMKFSSPCPSNSDCEPVQTVAGPPLSVVQQLIHLCRFSGYFSLDLFSQSYATCPPRSWCCTPTQNTCFTCRPLKRYPSDDSQFLSVEDSFVEEISMLAWRHDLTLCRVCCVLSCGPQQHTFSMLWRLRTNFICSYSPLTFRSHRFTSLR